tara:strand:+ start:275 stop:781 length:507 start_codon:yes stop_codon:yes gene_type:complete
MSGLIGQVGAKSGIVGPIPDTPLQYVAKQMRNGGNYFSADITASGSADPDTTGVVVTFPREFTSGSHLVWHYYASEANNTGMTHFQDCRVKPYYKNTSNSWATIDSIVWPNDKNFFIQASYPSSSIGSDKKVGFGVAYHSGSGFVKMANNYGFAMIVAYEINFTISPL